MRQALFASRCHDERLLTEQGAQESCVQRIVYVDGLVARGEHADPGRPLQQRRRRMFAREDRRQVLHCRLDTACAPTGVPEAM